MADFLNTLYLYGDVKITRDYSTVHDLTPSAWLTYLKTQTPVWTDSVNYYRLPSVIRIEGNYDTLRKATYGALEGVEPFSTPTFKRPVFFWVDEVRLIKQASFLDTDNSLVNDVVELVISPDVWSNCNGQFELYDSWIVRRHMDRWKTVGGVKTPVYYPDAADSVTGAMLPESTQKVVPSYTVTLNGVDYDIDLRWIVINVLDADGQQKYYIIPDTSTRDSGWGTVVFCRDGPNSNAALSDLSNILTGDFFTGAGITVDYIQSITVVPDIPTFTVTVSGSYLILDGYYAYFKYESSTNDGVTSYYYTLFNNQRITLFDGLWGSKQHSVTPVEPVWTDPENDTVYKDAREPMLYHAPARTRKVVNGVGGTVIDVPDVDAFRKVFTTQNLFDLTTAVTFVFGGSDLVEANTLGNVGVIESASLPIYNSAWKSYQAINKVGDEISYNAQQASTVANGLAGAAASGGMGAMAGGPIGAVLGAVTSLVGTGTQMYSNSENLRAKQTVIRNSPCNVKSSGSGLGAMIADYIGVKYVTMKVDDVSFEKLKTQYYYYGYNVGEVDSGTVDLTTRKYFDYIETRGARVRGDLNASEASQIAAIFDRGVRIYHGTAGYGQIGAGMSLENYEV